MLASKVGSRSMGSLYLLLCPVTIKGFSSAFKGSRSCRMRAHGPHSATEPLNELGVVIYNRAQEKLK